MQTRIFLIILRTLITILLVNVMSSEFDVSKPPLTDIAPSMPDAVTAPQIIEATTQADAPLDAVEMGLGFSEQMIDLLTIGGPVVWVLTALSFISLTIILLKVWQFVAIRPEQHQQRKLALNYWAKGETANAMDALRSERPIDRLLKNAMQGILDRTPLKTLEMELTRQAQAIQYQCRLLLRPLEVIASLSPLLGLMGTVLGMIEAFQQMQAAGAKVDPSVLSGGIWQALLTTAAGLAVAIPVAAAHSWFDRKAERVAHQINDAVAQIFTHNTGASVITYSNEERERHAA